VKLGEGRRFQGPLRPETQDAVARRRVAGRIHEQNRSRRLAQEPPVPPEKNSSGARVLLLARCLPEIDLLPSPKDSALSGRYV
jgi:hypothetical protein